jgi:phosphatidylglycerophosphatase A
MKKLVPVRPITHPVKKFFILGIVSGLGLGYSPKAPGTAGSLLGIPLGLYLLKFPVAYAVLFLIVSAFLASLLAQRAGDHWGERDSSKIVIDEVIGQALALLGLWVLKEPNSSITSWVLFIIMSFGLFRAFDITKPFPANVLDRHNSGFGVIGDDLIAGLYAAIVVRFLIPLFEAN